MNQHIPCIKTALFLAFYIFYRVVEKVLMWRSSVGLGMKTRLPMFWLRGKVVFNSSKMADCIKEDCLLCDKGITIYLTIMSCEGTKSWQGKTRTIRKRKKKCFSVLKLGTKVSSYLFQLESVDLIHLVKELQLGPKDCQQRSITDTARCLCFLQLRG